MNSLVCIFFFPLGLVLAEIGDLAATFLDSWVHHNQRSALNVFLEDARVVSEESAPFRDWFQHDEYHFDYCDFSGVGCDSVGYVVSINVSDARLNGTLPNDIGKLSRLRTFRANGNDLKGSIPASISQLTDLHYLNLGHNQMEGILPDFSTLLSLRRVFVDRNAFSGTVPSPLCHLKQLDTLDLSGITKMWGSLPACLGNLTKLTRLRITDIALTGEIPQGLCAKQQYGCDGIGCAAGTFLRGSGRQLSPDIPCELCDVPSNVIASTTCRWQQEDYVSIPTVAPTTINGVNTRSPSATLSPVVSSVSPSLAVTETGFWVSDSPSATRSTAPSSTPSDVPSFSPSEESKSISPEHVISSSPSVEPSSQATMRPTSPPALPAVSAIVQESTKSKNVGRQALIPATVAVCAVIVCAAFCAWKRKEALKQDRYLHVDKPGSKPLSEEQGDESGKDPNSPEPLVFLETPETVDASELSEPPAATPYTTRIPSILKRRSSSSTATTGSFVRSPSGRKVRFSLPHRFSWTSTEARGSENDDLDDKSATNSEQESNSEREPSSEPETCANDFDAWVSWIMNPLAEVGNVLSSVAEADESDVCASSSYESSTNNSDAPLLPTDDNSSAFLDDDSSAQEDTHSVGSKADSTLYDDINDEPLLGIRERKPVDDDTQALLEAGKLFHQGSGAAANASDQTMQTDAGAVTIADARRTPVNSKNQGMEDEQGPHEEGVELMEI